MWYKSFYSCCWQRLIGFGLMLQILTNCGEYFFLFYVFTFLIKRFLIRLWTDLGFSIIISATEENEIMYHQRDFSIYEINTFSILMVLFSFILVGINFIPLNIAKKNYSETVSSERYAQRFWTAFHPFNGDYFKKFSRIEICKKLHAELWNVY